MPFRPHGEGSAGLPVSVPSPGPEELLLRKSMCRLHPAPPSIISIGTFPPFDRPRVIDRDPDRFGHRAGDGPAHLVQQPVQLLLRLQEFRNQRVLSHFLLKRLRFLLGGVVIRMIMAKSLGLFKLLLFAL